MVDAVKLGIDGLITPDTLIVQRKLEAQKRFEQLQQTLPGQQLIGAVGGQAVGNAIGRLLMNHGAASDPEMEKAQRVQQGLDGVDSKWEDDESLSDYANQAAKMKAYKAALHADLSPAQRFQADANVLGLTTQDYNISRLKASDARAEEKAKRDQESSQLDLTMSQLALQAAQDKLKYGDTKVQNVYIDPNGREVTVPSGSAIERLILDDTGQYQYGGTTLQRQQAAIQRSRDKIALDRYNAGEIRKDATVERALDGGAKKAFTQQERANFKNLDDASRVLQQMTKEGLTKDANGKTAFDKAQGIQGRAAVVRDWLDRTVGDIVPIGASDTSKLARLIEQWTRIGASLSKGNQSDLDQRVFNATIISRPGSPEQNIQKLALSRIATVHSLQAAYLDAVQRVGAGREQYIPNSLISGMIALGIDPKDVQDIQTVDAEYERDAEAALAKITGATAADKPEGSLGD